MSRQRVSKRQVGRQGVMDEKSGRYTRKNPRKRKKVREGREEILTRSK